MVSHHDHHAAPRVPAAMHTLGASQHETRGRGHRPLGAMRPRPVSCSALRHGLNDGRDPCRALRTPPPFPLRGKVDHRGAQAARRAQQPADRFVSHADCFEIAYRKARGHGGRQCSEEHSAGARRDLRRRFAALLARASFGARCKRPSIVQLTRFRRLRRRCLHGHAAIDIQKSAGNKRISPIFRGSIPGASTMISNTWDASGQFPGETPASDSRPPDIGPGAPPANLSAFTRRPSLPARTGPRPRTAVARVSPGRSSRWRRAPRRERRPPLSCGPSSAARA
jgi:hypothetical protein